MNRLIMFVVLLFSLTGCSFVPYKPPSTGETATIDYVVNSSGFGGFGLIVFEGENCTVPRAMIDRRQAPEGESTILQGVHIPASRPTSFLAANISGSGAYCAAPFKFTPETGRSYIIEFTNDDSFCSVVVKYNANGKMLPEPTLTALKYKEPFSTSSSFCEK